VIDGEAVLLGVDGRSDFDGLHSRKHDDQVQFYAFDCLVSDGDDLRSCRSRCARPTCSGCWRRVSTGSFLSDFEQGEISPELFRHACPMGLEGLVSKLKDRPYRPGRSPNWMKVKNRQHPAFSRVME
jgi:bifunctional non-homologous end joining protein LigD